ncbi:hypothetical protein IFM89_030935 [Coptis chinensis]|uniref:Alpha/beta hydrolase fold-3 domain-containing protein n=1 Tax=Coptis chinensis TaxID=261450 RepID=A0A835HQK8_9MAGN|nr:hypothetical protein IFM89_030935 [Coptis chinensis]
MFTAPLHCSNKQLIKNFKLKRGCRKETWLPSLSTVVSVDYRLAPEYPLPIAYEDSWATLKWVASHSSGQESETWLKEFVDFNKVFLAGDSAGANIAHNMAMLAGDPTTGLSMKIHGVVLVHPFFWGSEAIGSETTDIHKKGFVDRIWPLVSPSAPSNDEPLINPLRDGGPSFSSLGCTRVLVCVAGKDILRDRGWLYYDRLSKCGWTGVVEIIETEGEDHVFHLDNPTCRKSYDFIERLADFFNRDRARLL